jgi:RHS repeat-associated protein
MNHFSTARDVEMFMVEGAIVEGNSFAGDFRISEGTNTLTSVIRFNDLSSASWTSSTAKPRDLRLNWWGHIVPSPPFCRTPITPTHPRTEITAYAECEGSILVTGYQANVLPALTVPVYATSAPGGSFTPGEWFGGSNASSAAQPCGTNVGHPIECSSGNFWHRFDGLAVPGRGVPLDFNFTYNSHAAATAGPLGYGWAHSYGMHLEIIGSKAVVHQENGAQVPFAFDGSDWAAPSRFDANLESAGGTWIFTRRGVERFTFDGSGRLTSQRRLTDPTSYVTTVTYPSAGTMVATDVAGRALTFTLSGGRLTSVADTASPTRSISFDYNAANELVGYTDAAGGSWAFGYDGSHRLTTMRKPSGEGMADPPLLTNEYDDEGRVVEQTDWEERTITLEYATPPGANVTTTLVTDPRGNKTMKVFGHGVLIGKIEGYGTASESLWAYELDPNTLGVTRVIHPDGTSTTASYDDRGRVMSFTDQLDRDWSWTYDQFSNVLTETSPNPSMTGPDSVTATYSYDSGRLVSVSRPLHTDATTSTPQETIYARDDSAHPDDVTAISDPEGATTSFDHDPATGDLLSVTDPEGHTTSFGYDGVGRLTSIVAPKGNVSGANPSEWTTTLSYDPNNQLIDVVEHVNATTTATTSRTYDPDGNLASATDPNGNTTTYSYDDAGQLIEVHRPDGSVLANAYWPDGQLRTQVDGNATAAMSYDHDAQGRPVSVTDALGNATTFGYDPAGNVAWKADPGGACPAEGTGTGCTRYSYDDARQLTGIAYSDGTTPAVSYAYGRAGQRTTMTDGTGTSTYTYDSLGRLTSHTDGADTTAGYGYDLANRPTSLDYPGLGTVTYAWDDAGRIDTVTDWDDRIFDYTHDPNGNVTHIAFPSGSGNVDGFAYDHADRMTGTITAHNATWTSLVLYSRDLAGQVTADQQGGLPGGNRTYGYTKLGQLCYAAPAGTGSCDTPPASATSYTYDPADNLTTTSVFANQQFNDANQVCWASETPATGTCDTAPSGAATFVYDARGNRTTTALPGGGGLTYTYDQANRLTGTSGAITSSYAYNGDGLRTEATIEAGTAAFTWNLAGPLPLVIDDGTNAYLYGPDGAPLAHEDTDTGEVAYYHHDQLGSTRRLTGADGTTLGTATYDAHGNPTDTTGQTTPLGYAGEYTDPHTGLQYLRARYYDPDTAQFLTRDPIEAITREAYAYAGNNPINMVDPMGLCGWRDAWNCVDDAWDATGGRAATAIREKVTDPHFWVDAGTGALVAIGTSACIAGTAGVGTVACVGGAVMAGTALGGGAHLGVNALTPGNDGDYGAYQAFAHSFVSSSFSAVCVISIGQLSVPPLTGHVDYAA